MSFSSKKTKHAHLKQYIDYSENEINNLEFEQVLEAGHKVHLVIFGNLIIGLITALIMWDGLPKMMLTAWITLLIISIFPRIAILLNYKKVRAETQQRWQIYFIGASLFSGIVWGIGALLIEIYAPAIYHGFIAFIIGGIAAGGIATNSFIRWNYPAFMVPMLSSIAIFYLYQNDISHLLMAAMIVAFMIILGSSAITFRNNQFEKHAMLQLASESLNKLQDSEQRLKDITSSMGEGVFVVDKTGFLTFINPEGERMLGWNFQELKENKEDLDSKIHVHNHNDPAEGLLKSVLKYGATVYSTNAQFKRKDGTFFPVSSTAAPMHSKDGGVVVVFQDITTQKELEKKLEMLALRDALTGLYNRGKFDETLKDELARAERYKRSISLLILDIDSFKKVNDTYGHQAGDEVLKDIANIISSSIRNSDYAARYGGEEFTVILPETDLTRAIELAERIRVTVAQKEFKISENNTIQLTISIGVGSSSKEISPELLIKSADSALYKAKENGRNRVEYI